MRGGVVARPYLAINHIRDQLIPPQDRKRKQKLWAKVVTYIRESESRVREEVQTVYGEENRVWRWIPDMTWAPPSTLTVPIRLSSVRQPRRLSFRHHQFLHS